MTSSRAGEENTTMSRPDQTSRPAGEDQQAGTEASTSTSRPRLKKDGTPDRRNGNPGNPGNKYATGRKHIDGQEVRRLISFVATDKEYTLLLKYASILKSDYEQGLATLAALGTPPTGRAKKDSDRSKRVIRVLEREKKPIRQMLSIIKDRYEAAYIILGRF
jgi:hypothetical protein